MSTPDPSPDPLVEAETALRRVWGHPALRPGQREALAAVLAGRDVLAVLPTGGGKSLVYQLPAVAQGGLALVVSPLVALMHDQVEALRARRVPALALHAGLAHREIEQALTDAEFGRYRLLYLTPERLRSELFVARAGRLPVTLLAVDEAHCISEWGHAFRPEYRQIADARSLLRHPEGCAVPIVAVTATATPEVRRDVVEQLALRDPVVVVRGFDRPEIVWSVHRVEDKRAKVREIADAIPGSGLLYAGTRRGAEAWADALTKDGIPAEAYHAGLDGEKRQAVQRRWLDGATRYVAATSAFGMGIDKPDVRAVIHVELPPTLEAYYQEAGRAGRDGRRAWAALLLRVGDDALPRSLAEEGHPDARTVAAVFDAVASLAQVPVGSTPDGPVGVDLAAAVRVAGTTPRAAKAAVQALARAGVWEVLPPHPHRGLLRFLQPPEAIRAFADAQAGRALGRFVRLLLRAVHADAFSGWGEVDLLLLERRSRLPRERLLKGLAFLAARGVLAFHAPADGLRVVFAGPRPARLALDAAALARVRRRALGHLDEVLAYAASVTCRRQYLLAYFGETAPARCGRCDVCLGRHRPVVTPADEPLLRQLLDHVAAADDRARWLPGVAVHQRDGLTDWLVAEGYLRVADPLGPTFDLTAKGLRARKEGPLDPAPPTSEGEGA
ncbi:MAG TPA: RecQ family ATP-dependent DNA helicase [Rubricoccaceae bacterium]|nr:RecQ family ATP-dependent DNA helicase [Rubricoccaceae bacterium]